MHARDDSPASRAGVPARKKGERETRLRCELACQEKRKEKRTRRLACIASCAARSGVRHCTPRPARRSCAVSCDAETRAVSCAAICGASGVRYSSGGARAPSKNSSRAPMNASRRKRHHRPARPVIAGFVGSSRRVSAFPGRSRPESSGLFFRWATKTPGLGGDSATLRTTDDHTPRVPPPETPSPTSTQAALPVPSARPSAPPQLRRALWFAL